MVLLILVLAMLLPYSCYGLVLLLVFDSSQWLIGQIYGENCALSILALFGGLYVYGSSLGSYYVVFLGLVGCA